MHEPSHLEPEKIPTKKRIGRLHKGMQWCLLILLSVLLIGIGEIAHLPAASLLGAMVAGVLLTTNDSTIRTNRWLPLYAQAVVGLLIARSITGEFFVNMSNYLPIIAISVVFVLFASTLNGYLLARFKIIPGTTAVWGSAPGAASAMTLMAASYGADQRLVAFMQYLRVAIVASAASLVMRFNTPIDQNALAEQIWFPPIVLQTLLPTLALIIGGAILGEKSRIPTGAMIVPMVLGTILQDTGVMVIDLPPWLLAASYVLIGWRIGLSFTRAIVANAARAFPAVLTSILGLVAVCGMFGFVLSQLLGLDPLTAYLATSPGGADTVAIIAASSNADLPFIVAMQTSRFLIVLLVGPALSRFVASLLLKRSAPK